MVQPYERIQKDVDTHIMEDPSKISNGNDRYSHYYKKDEGRSCRPASNRHESATPTMQMNVDDITSCPTPPVEQPLSSNQHLRT